MNKVPTFTSIMANVFAWGFFATSIITVTGKEYEMAIVLLLMALFFKRDIQYYPQEI